MTEGVRVSGIDPQWSQDLLWKKFPDASNIYYPLMNNDAVIIFKDSAAILRELQQTHEKWKVVPLPHQVFSKHSAWVDKDLSAVLQASPAYLDTLKQVGNLDVIFDNKQDGYKLTGQSYQIEWAWNHLSSVRDNQLSIAHTVQAECHTGSASLKLSNGDALTNGDSDLDHHSHPEMSHRSSLSSRRKAGAEFPEERSLPEAGEVEPVERERLSAREPVSSMLGLDAAASGGHGNARSGARSPYHGGRSSRTLEENPDDYGRARGGLGPTSLRVEAGRPGVTTRRERCRQDDENDTFHHFSSLPATVNTGGQGQRKSTPNDDTRPGSSSSSRRGGVLTTDIDEAEAEHKYERRSQTMGYGGVSDIDDEEGAVGGYASLQPYNSQKNDYQADRGFSSLHSSVFNEWSRKSFKVSRQLDMKLKLKIYMGDITKSKTDAVVNAANWELKNVGGVAGALAKAAGPEMAIECDRLNRRLGKLETGQVVETGAYGGLSHLKCVIHTVGPLYMATDEEKNIFELTQTFYNCLQFADDRQNLESVTFPFISTGIFGMPIDDCVLALVTALHVFGYERLLKQPNKQFTRPPTLQEVHFIHNDVNVVCEAILIADTLFQRETAESALQRMKEGRQQHGRYVFPYCSSHGDRSSSLLTNSRDRSRKGGSGSREIDYGDLYDRHASWDSSQPVAAAGAVDTSNSRSQHQSDTLSVRSAPVSLPSAALRRSGSLDRGRKPLVSSSEEGKSSQASGGRDPSPRPRSRSNSLGVKKRNSPSTSSRPLTVAGVSAKQGSPDFTREAVGGKHTPVIKQNLGPAGSKSKSSLLKKLAKGPGRTSDYSGNDTDSASAAGSEVDDADNNCPICLEPLRRPKKLPCGHQFCTDCVDRAVSVNPKCPKCQRLFGIAKGIQPKNGTMTHTVSRLTSLPGYEGHGTIVIQYYIPAGTQEACHPCPGRWYGSTQRTAYLPDNKEGREVLKMLQKAFDHRLIFTVGDSVTTGARGVVTWNDIHHKTATHGGPTSFGYPDPGYLKRVKEELAAKGITSA